MNIGDLHIIGAGSLGSFTSFLLSREADILDCRINVYDFDIVERGNINNQLYRLKDVGKLKVDALKSIIKDGNNFDLRTFNARIEDGQFLRGVPVVLVDTIGSRRNIFKSCAYDATIPFYVEARTGTNIALVYAFNPRRKDWVDRYMDTLFDKSVEERPCADREMVPVLWAVASAITRILLSVKQQKVFTDEFIELVCDFEHWPAMKPAIIEEI